ncbi:MAG: hypothetical protein AUG51_11570 [Acidobacteria bacterium 13_1_20CM_3_53_8]|nr:MAG: hypothetical protein AUG51_11570 [Acidobacteria bacterium 13_1_20CM_3_53_8]
MTVHAKAQRKMLKLANGLSRCSRFEISSCSQQVFGSEINSITPVLSMQLVPARATLGRKLFFK